MFFKKNTWYWEMYKRTYREWVGVFSLFFSYYSRSNFSPQESYENISCSSSISSGAAQPNLVKECVARALNNQGRHGKTPYFSGWNKLCQFFQVVLSPGALNKLRWYGILSFATFHWITSEKFCNLYLTCLIQNRSKDLFFFQVYFLMSMPWSNREKTHTFILPLCVEVLVVGKEGETFWGLALILDIHFAVWANQCTSLCPSFSICETEILLLWDLRWLGSAVVV